MNGRWRILALALAAVTGLVTWRVLKGAQRVALSPGIERTMGAIEARRFPRPVHRGPSQPGRFAEAAAEAWGGALAIEEGLTNAPCRAGAARDERACAAVEEATRPALQRLLDATLREDGGFGARGAIMAPLTAGTHRVALSVCRRAALELDALTARSDRAGALRTCADALAWGRDMALGASTAQMLLAVRCIEDEAAPACARALALASPSERRELLPALAIVRSGMPELGDLVRDDAAVSWVRSCGALFDDDARARLSPLGRAVSLEIETPDDMRYRIDYAAICRAGQSATEALWRLPPADVVRDTRTESQAAFGRATDAVDALVSAAATAQ